MAADGGNILTFPTHASAGYTITQTALMFGITARALRHYEQLGVIDPPRDGRNVRRYGGELLKTVQIIAALRAAGMSISEIARVYGDRRQDRSPLEVIDAIEDRLAFLDKEKEALAALLRTLNG